MKAIATGDLHIDKNNRLDDTLASLRQIMNYAVKEKVNFVYVLGDVYERKRPYNSEKAIFEKFVKYLSDKGIEVIVISGNHDMDSDQISAVEEFKILELPYVSLKTNPCMVTLGKFKIFLGHFLVQGAKLGPTDYQITSPISLGDILNRYRADMYCLGDVHKAQKLNDDPPVIYTGSIERTDFGEREEKKGFVLITAGEKLEYKFIPLQIRPMVQIDIDYGNLNELNTLNVDEAVVKLNISCSKEEYGNIDELQIRNQLVKANKLTIEYNIIKKTRIRSKKIKESLSPSKAFEHYAQLKEFDKETIILGLQIMENIK